MKWWRVIREMMKKIMRLKKELTTRSLSRVIMSTKIIRRPSKLCRDRRRGAKVGNFPKEGEENLEFASNVIDCWQRLGNMSRQHM